MGVLSRRRSLLIKLIVVVTTAWFTIAFLLYSENRSENPVALPLENNENNRNIIDEPIRKELVQEESDKKFADSAVLRPPEDKPGEMGKAVVLPTNLTGKF